MRHLALFLTACAILGMLFVASTAIPGERAPDPALSITMTLQNQKGPFVTRNFAERLARPVIEEKYQRNIFVITGSAKVLEADGMWWVTFSNALPHSESSYSDRPALPCKSGRRMAK
jgi:hypothetical protein